MKSNNTNISFTIIGGARKVMFSAPHSVEQLRGDSIKQAEPATGEIAKQLTKYEYPAIIKAFNNNDDANYDAVSDYKLALKEYIESKSIKYLFDLHELNPARTMDVCIGTGHGRNIFGRENLVEIIKSSLSENGVEIVTVDDPFAASYENTVCAYIARECKIPCIQIEMNSKLFMHDEKWIETFVKIFDSISSEFINL